MNDPTTIERVSRLEQHYARLEQQLDKLLALGDVEESIVTDVIEVSIAKLEPTVDDVVFIWLPADKGLTEAQIQQVGAQLGAVIQGRFKFIVLVKGAVEVEVIKGKHSPILLPS